MIPPLPQNRTSLFCWLQLDDQTEEQQETFMLLKNSVSPSRLPGAHYASPAGHRALGLTTVNLVQTPCKCVCFTCAPRRLRAATGQPVLTPRVSTELERTHICVNKDGEVVSKAPGSKEPIDQWGAHGHFPHTQQGRAAGDFLPLGARAQEDCPRLGVFQRPLSITQPPK